MLATEIPTNDHNQALEWIDQLRQRIHDELGNELKFRDLDMDIALRLHMRVEEEIFYPALEEDAEFTGLMAASVPEHNEIRDILNNLEALDDPSGDGFHAILSRLRIVVARHAENEEADIFPRALATPGPDRVDELGTLIDEEKTSASMTRSANM